MIFPLSLICAFGLVTACIVICIVNAVPWYFIILLSLATLIVVVALFCVLVMILLLTLGKKFAKTYNPKDKKRWFFMIDVARFSCFWLGVKVKVNGLEKLPKVGPVVFYCNHESYLDMFILYTILHKWPHATMYKKVIETYPLASGMAKALGGVSIEREDDREALKSIIKIIGEVKEGVNFLNFPEGTRAKTSRLNHYKAGSFKVVQKANVPAVLLALDGTFKKMMTAPFIPTFIYFNVVDVIYPEDFKDKSTQELADEATKLVQADIDKARSKYKSLKYRHHKD